MTRFALPLALLALLALLLSACSKDRSAREWSPQDHDQPASAPATAAADPGAQDPYRSACAPCHGIDGKGDGPMGRSLRVADLSSVAWQERVSDQEIAKVIVEGRGKMPGFNLPPAEVDALVKKVRSFRK
jgi:mono/diheme cytochrome c family protein